MNINYVDIVNKSFENVEKNIHSLDKAVFDIKGMSSRKIRIFMNSVCSFEGCRYLEIGSHRGSTFCSAINNNNIFAVSIDNFSTCVNVFGDNPQQDFHNNINAFKTNSDVVIINEDCWKADIKKYGRFNVYFYDGNHTQEDQRRAFVQFNDSLEDEFIAIVDDADAECVKDGTMMAFKDLKYNVIKEWYEKSESPNNSKSWWCGFYVAVIKK